MLISNTSGSEMEEKEKQYYLKQWHVVALSALVLSIIVFTASLGILVGLPALIEKNVREVVLCLRWINSMFV